MAAFILSISASRFRLVIIRLITLNFIFRLTNSTQTSNYPSFDPQVVALRRDNAFRPNPYAAIPSLLMYVNPFKFQDSSPSKATSFSTEFSFSFTGNANRLSLLMGPNNFAPQFLGQAPSEFYGEKGYLGIHFDASNVADFNAGHVSVSVMNEQSRHIVTVGGEKFKSWIDYDAKSKRVDVRISKFGDIRPRNPIVSFSIDLSEMWGDSGVYVGLGSLNGNVSESCIVYSWRFWLRKVPNWMHSLPVDPHSYYMDQHKQDLRMKKKKKKTSCPFVMLSSWIIFATGCGALMAFLGLFVWAAIVNRYTVFPMENNLLPVGFKYEKLRTETYKNAKILDK
ncbi:hypothetical protein K2173_011082 [Erythroxylum novogranatense]|uniref:Legume lectin domain-containing protein n=1 Tax=Erythroxylum novogranatense TaxID=1862640 RepID=A0AAV8T0E9_9ROSI|nr:hypothetical protein K2173_011082 [Erythroxylum novogranatense]